MISFGYDTTRPEDEILPLADGNFSTVGLCSTSEDADATKFPLNTAVRFSSIDPAYLNKLGTGELAAAVRGLNDQLEGFGADLTVVRVAVGTGADAAAKLAATFANIIGDPGTGTGLWALRNAPVTVKVALHLIGAPGYTHQQPDGPTVDNPIRVALAAHLAAMKAIAIVDVDATTKEKAIGARELMSSDRIMPLGVAARVYETIDGASTLVTRPMSPRILGLIVNVDRKIGGGLPFEPFANRPIVGIADTSRRINYDLGDGSTEAQMLLADDVAVVVPGAIASSGAIADGGFTFIGVESCATGDLWSQIHQVRSADYVDEQMGRITRLYLGGRITPRRAEAWLSALKFLLLEHVQNERLLGYKLDFPKVINSIEDVRLGDLSIETRIEPAPVFRRAHNAVRRYRPAVEALIDAIVARAGSSSAVVS